MKDAGRRRQGSRRAPEHAAGSAPVWSPPSITTWPLTNRSRPHQGHLQSLDTAPTECLALHSRKVLSFLPREANEVYGEVGAHDERKLVDSGPAPDRGFAFVDHRILRPDQ